MVVPVGVAPLLMEVEHAAPGTRFRFRPSLCHLASLALNVFLMFYCFSLALLHESRLKPTAEQNLLIQTDKAPTALLRGVGDVLGEAGSQASSHAKVRPCTP